MLEEQVESSCLLLLICIAYGLIALCMCQNFQIIKYYLSLFFSSNALAEEETVEEEINWRTQYVKDDDNFCTMDSEVKRNTQSNKNIGLLSLELEECLDEGFVWGNSKVNNMAKLECAYIMTPSSLGDTEVRREKCALSQNYSSDKNIVSRLLKNADNNMSFKKSNSFEVNEAGTHGSIKSISTNITDRCIFTSKKKQVRFA